MMEQQQQNLHGAVKTTGTSLPSPKTCAWIAGSASAMVVMVAYAWFVMYHTPEAAAQELESFSWNVLAVVSAIVTACGGVALVSREGR